MEPVNGDLDFTEEETTILKKKLAEWKEKCESIKQINQLKTINELRMELDRTIRDLNKMCFYVFDDGFNRGCNINDIKDRHRKRNGYNYTHKP